MSLSLAAVLADTAARRPEHPAVVHNGRQWRYAELWEAARRYATVLSIHGVGPGDRVALALSNRPAFPMAYFGALALGAVVVPVNVLLTAGETEYMLRDCGARAVVCEDGSAARVAADAAGVPALLVGDRGEEGGVSGGTERIDVAARAATPVPSLRWRRPDDLALVLYTSGTTGRPKGAMLTQLNVLMNVSTTRLSPFDMRPEDVLFGCLPLSHAFGQICGMLTCMHAGATMVLTDRFAAGPALDAMVRHRCTVFMGVPTMYLDLLDAAGRDPRRPHLDRAFSGGSALPVAVLEEFERVFGCPIYEGYGLTETAPVVAYNQRSWPCRPGTVGRPIWGVEVAVTRSDGDGPVTPLPVGEVGEIVVRGHNVMAGYLNRPEATAAVLTEDGWFRTGDLGVLDTDGYVTVVDRKKDMVLRGGFNVYPREVEEVLVRHPAVAQVAVLGVPHARYGEEVCAVVRPRRGHEPDARLRAELVAFGRERLAAYKYPRLVEFVTSFPLSSTGKVLKRELAARLAAGGETRSSDPVPAVERGR